VVGMHVVEHHDIHHDDLFSWKKIHIDYRCIKHWEARLYTMNLHMLDSIAPPAHVPSMATESVLCSLGNQGGAGSS
jgi:hypothetical protein